ncbi:MAG: DUF4831 family protein [Bacteroidales bacterium]|jgi:hypothetical protein|nr:DUF4831 family protein [Bacteroidales bacterium]
MKRILLVSLSLLWIINAGKGQVNIYPVTGNMNKPEKNGVFFALPRAVVKVTLKVREIENFKGPYAEYAGQLLGISNPVMQYSKEYEIADMGLDVLSEPDPDRVYYFEVDERTSKEDRNVSIETTGEGVVKAINGISLQKPVRNVQDETKILSYTDLFEGGITSSLFRRVDTVIRTVTIDTATIRKRYFNTFFEEKPTEMKAREAADMISRIRESRFNLITGYQETNFSRETMEYMDKNLQRMLQDYISLFRGVRTEQIVTYIFYIIPAENKPNQIVCRFSKELGVLEASDNKGKEVVLSVRRSGNWAQVPAWAPKPSAKAPAAPYIVPEMVQLNLKYNNRIYDDTYVPIPQFGTISQMPIFRSRVIYDTRTGNVREVLFE